MCNLTHLQDGDTMWNLLTPDPDPKPSENSDPDPKKIIPDGPQCFQVKCCRASLEEVPFAKEFEFRAENYSMELAEKEICRTLK